MKRYFGIILTPIFFLILAACQSAPPQLVETNAVNPTPSSTPSFQASSTPAPDALLLPADLTATEAIVEWKKTLAVNQTQHAIRETGIAQTVFVLAQTPSLTPIPTSTSPYSPTQLPTPLANAGIITPLPNLPLSDNGPWLLLLSGNTVWAINADGSGLTTILEQASDEFPPFTPLFFQVYPAPLGGRVAIIQSGGETMSTNPILTILSLPTGNFQEVTQLLSDFLYNQLFTPIFDAENYINLTQIFAAIGLYRNISWSPNGKLLAFSGAMDGPSADLYLYSTENGQIIRLTDGPSQAVDPVWSPDGTQIVHGGVDTLYYGYSGAGYGNYRVWSASPDGTEVKFVYPGVEHGFEIVVDWLSNTSFLVDNSDWWAGYLNLRYVDIKTNEIHQLWCGYYSDRDYDPTSKKIFISAIDFPNENCEASPAAGLYILSLDDRTIFQVPNLNIAPEAWRITSWEWSKEVNLLFGETSDGFVSVSTDGNVSLLSLPANAPPKTSPDGKYWAITTDAGIWVKSEQEAYYLKNGKIIWMSWSPDGASLFFIQELYSKHILYVAHAPSFLPGLVTEGEFLEYTPAYWIMP